MTFEKLLNELCLLNGTSGDEKNVRDYIIEKSNDVCAYGRGGNDSDLR